MKKYKHKSNKKPTDRVGFYIALSICLVAVGLAVYSTYTSVSDYLKESEDEYMSTLVETTAPVAKDVTGVTEEATEPAATHDEAVVSETRKESLTLYETATLPETEDVDAQSELDSLSPVFRVKESLIYPVESKSVLREYSEDAVYNSTMKDYRAHTGTDFKAETGENVYAMCDGVVRKISFDERYGVIIEVTNDEYTIYYCGVDSDTNVHMKDQVKQGDVIGYVSQVPCESKDPVHLHVEIKVGDEFIDPLSVILNDR